MPVGCGQCLPCRVNRRRVWMTRQVLESFMHDENCFVTLTYDPDHLPADGSVDPKETSLWMKRLRKAVWKLEPGRRVRFFLCGEYGDETFRPHYHASLFGLGQAWEPVIRESWGKGHVLAAEFNEQTAQYVSGYVVKKMTDREDPRLNGRHPEYVRMSNRPGIGAPAMTVIRDAVLTEAGLDEYEAVGDVPMMIQIGKRKLPLGRYLRRKLREEVGVSEKEIADTKSRFYAESCEEVFTLLSRSILDGEALSTSALIARDKLGKIRSVEARSKIYSGKGKL